MNKIPKKKIEKEFDVPSFEEIIAEIAPTQDIVPLEFSHGLHVTRDEFNEVVAKLNEVIRKK